MLLSFIKLIAVEKFERLCGLKPGTVFAVVIDTTRIGLWNDVEISEALCLFRLRKLANVKI